MIPRIRIDYGTGLQDAALPFNAEEIAWESIFTSQFPSATLKAVLFEWRGDTAKKLNAYFDAGMTGGDGVGEGVPLEVTTGNPPIKYNCVINLADISISREPEIFKAPIKLVGSIDWLSDTLESITYLLLQQTPLPAKGSLPAYPAIIGLPGSGAKYTYKMVPYVVTVPTDWVQAINLILQEYAMLTALIKAINDTTTDITNISAGSATDTAEAGLFTASEVGFIAALVIQIVYDAILIIAIIGNIEMLLNQFGLVKRYKYAMTVRDEVNAAIDYINNLGAGPAYTFSSSIFNTPGQPYYNLSLMPRKSLKETSTLTKAMLTGGPITRGTEINIPNTYGYYDYDAKKLVQQTCEVFNAKGYLFGNNFSIEEIHHYNNKASYNLKNVDKPGYNFSLPKPDTTNWSELAWYTRRAWMLDSMDERTSIVYTGTSCSVTLQPKIVKNQLNIIAPGSDNKTFPFALAKRKEYLNTIELIINDIINVVVAPVNLYISGVNALISGINAVLSLFGASPIASLAYLPTNILYGLIGCLEVSGDQWNEMKMFLGTPVGGSGAKNLEGVYQNADWQIDPNNGANNNGVWVNPNAGTGTKYPGEGWMSAYALMQQFHGLNLATRGNQWLIYKGKRFPMTSKDFLTILGNNVFITADGKFGKFDKLLWKIFRDEAQNVDYRVNAQYTNNLYEILSVDGN